MLPSSAYIHKYSSKDTVGKNRIRLDLLEACKTGRIEYVKDCLKLPNFEREFSKLDKNGNGAIHYAVRYNHIEIVEALLKNGADVNMPGFEKATPLHIAARYFHKSTMKMLSVSSEDDTPCTSKEKSFELAKTNSQKPDTDNNNVQAFEQMQSSSITSESSSSKLKPKHLYDYLKPAKTSGKPIMSSVTTSIGENVVTSRNMIQLLLFYSANPNALDLSKATPLHYAASVCNFHAAVELLKCDSIKIENKDQFWKTALHIAARHGSVEIVKELLKHRAEIDCIDQSNLTPLHLAASEGHADVVKLLINECMNRKNDLNSYINWLDSFSQTPLHYSILSGHQEIVSYLLQCGVDVEIPVIDEGSLSSLHLACIAGSLEMVKLLVNHCPELIKSRTLNLETALHKAAALNRLEIVQYLISIESEVNALDKSRETPIMVAAEKNHVAIVDLLLSAGADVRIKNLQDYTVLHICCEYNSFACAELLLKCESADFLQISIDMDHNTPLHIAAENGHLRLVEALLLNSAPPVDAKNDEGNTPLLLASLKGHLQVVDAFLQFSSHLCSDKDINNQTALHLAAMHGHANVVMSLIDSGAVVDSRDIRFDTPLDVAVKAGFADVVNILLDADSPIDPREKTKISPLMIACKFGHVQVVRLLLERGADTSRKDTNGRNCLDIAIDENRQDVASELVNSSQFHILLRNVNQSPDGTLNTPMMKLIRYMPEVAEEVLNRSIVSSNLPQTHSMYTLHCNYEFMEDFMYQPWASQYANYYDVTSNVPVGNYSPTVMSDVPTHEPASSSSYIHQKLSSNSSHYDKHDRSNCSFFKKLSTYLTFMLQDMTYRTHPLKLMVKKEREKLLSHRLVTYLLRNKWRKYGRFVYYTHFCLFVTFLICLTGFALTVPIKQDCMNSTTTSSPSLSISSSDPSDASVNARNLPNNVEFCEICPPISYDSEEVSSFIFVLLGKYIVLVLDIIFIFLKVVGGVSNFSNSVTVPNIIEFFGLFFTLIFVLGGFNVNYGIFGSSLRNYRCTNFFRSIGSLSLLFCWYSFVLLMRKLPKIGIYVVMYVDIIQTFFQFMPLYFVLLLCFAFPFHLLMFHRVDVNAYVTPGRSIMKTFLSMIGEIEYDTFYNTPDLLPLPVTWFVLFCFLVSNCMILMNLLVGLAVDDIQGVQSKAILKRIGLQVDMALSFEMYLPKSIRRRFVAVEEEVNPNHVSSWSFWSFWKFKVNPLKQSSQPKFSSSLECIKESQHCIEQSLNDFSERFKLMEQQIEELNFIVHKFVDEKSFHCSNESSNEQASQLVHHSDDKK